MSSEADAVLAALADLGCRLSAHGDLLRVEAPAALPPALLRAARAHKGELLVRLLGAPAPALSETGGTSLEELGTAVRRYMSPWPDALPNLGRRSVDFFDACADCWGQRWSWVRYGGMVLCLPCALHRVGATR